MPDSGKNRILLFLNNRENARLLAEWMSQHYDVVVSDRDDQLDDAFDLCLVDGPVVERLWRSLHARKFLENPVFLPYLLITSRQHADVLATHLWRTFDDLVFAPVDKLELQTRVEMLLRTRRLSLELKLRNDDLEAFIHAMTHDLRAPLRTISGFAESMLDDSAAVLGPDERHQLERIRSATDEMWSMIGCLLDFSRLGRKAVRLQTVFVREIVDSCLQSMTEQTRASGAEFEVESDLGDVNADPTLLKIALSNLIANGIKFVAPGTRPCIRILSSAARGIRRIRVQDTGIGLAPEDLQRIFTPFVRLHGVEDYPGFGLGLSAVRKVVEIMGGQIGVESTPGKGSTFWIELTSGEQA